MQHATVFAAQYTAQRRVRHPFPFPSSYFSPAAACNLALACPLSRILSAPQQRFAYNQSEAKLICHFAAVVVAAAAPAAAAGLAAAAAAVPGFNLANGIARLLNY